MTDVDVSYADLPDLDILILEEQIANGKATITVLREALDGARDLIHSGFYEGRDVVQLVRKHAALIDGILKVAWNRFSWTESEARWFKRRIGLVAVGGFGRGELHPHSDIDLLVLLERDSYAEHQDNIENFLMLLWDIGLPVAHSVRSIKECRVQASQDITIMTALMESRTLAGDPTLRERMLQAIRPGRIWSTKKFFQAKWDEQKERHEKYEHSEYALEPNVKTSPGGLRDIHVVMWVARRAFDIDGIDDLVNHQLLTISEAKALDRGRQFIWRIRYGLHLYAKRGDDRLSFEYQKRLADQFGYADSESLLGVERFMQDYFRTVRELSHVNELLLQHFDEAILRAGERDRIVPLNERFQTNHNYLETVHDNVFADYPPALMELFVLLGQNEAIEGVRAATIRLVRHSLHLVDDAFRRDPAVNDLFLEFLGSPHKLSSQFKRMNRYGILGAYLPAFGRIIGQMQYDMFHIYTVDEHTLQVIRNMRLFRYKNNEQRFPVAAHIFPRLPKTELLYVAALYHDIAKGRGGDHSELGQEDVEEFCRQHRLGRYDTNLLRWLVLNHLVMSTTAQRKDIADPEVIQDFAVFVQDQVRLDYLYALTVADINATNPSLWNGWRATLLRQLYLETKKALRRGPENYVDKAHYIEETKASALFRLTNKALDAVSVRALWATLPQEYFVRESAGQIAWHAEEIVTRNPGEDPLIRIRDRVHSKGQESVTHIFIHTQDKSYLFAACVNALDRLSLQVQDARIFSSSDGLVYNTFTVLEPDGTHVGEDAARIERIRATIAESIDRAEDLPTIAQRRTPLMLAQFDVSSEVVIKNGINNQTIVEVMTRDRPGLLTRISGIFVALGLNLLNAKITTLGERVEDVFYLDENGRGRVSDPETIEKLQRMIHAELNEPAGEG